MGHACSNDNISVVFSRADFNSAVALGWKRLHLTYDRIWSVLVDTIRSNTVPTTERCSAEHAAISTDRGTVGGQSIQNADGVAVRRWATAIIVRTPRGAVSMSHLPIWSPTTVPLGGVPGVLVPTVPSGPAAHSVELVASRIKNNMGSAVL